MSLSFNCAFCAVILCVGVFSKEVTLPQSVKTCKKDADDYSSCLRLAIQESWPTIINGFPELNFPKLDPYFTEVQDGVYENGDVRGRVQVKNVKTYGLAKSRFLSVRPTFDGDYFRLEIDVEMPKLFVEGEYKAEGSLGAFKMGGKGSFNISLEGVRTTWDIEGTIKHDRWIVEHFRTEPEVTKMKVWFSDLFNGNENLNRAAIDFVNEYWPLLYRGMLPIVSQSWDSMLTELVNRIFSKISFTRTFV